MLGKITHMLCKATYSLGKYSAPELHLQSCMDISEMKVSM